MAVRRSARLKLKEEEEQERYRTPLRGGQAVKRRLSSTSNSFSEEGSPPATSAIKEQLECQDIVSASDEDVVAVTPKRKQTRKTNNFLKLYNSYNRDDGYDLYEDEFIDDSEEVVNKKNRRKEKRTRRDSNSSSSSDIGGRRSKRKKAEMQLSSDEEIGQITSNRGNEPAGIIISKISVNDSHTRYSSDSDVECSLRRPRAAINRSRLDSYLSDSSEEDIKVKTKTRKKRRVQCPESDEELASFTPAKKSPSRAERLKQEKMSKRDTLLRKLKNNDDSPSPLENTNSLYLETPDDGGTSHSCFDPSKDVQFLGERVLFCVESEDSSDEGSDWIVSEEEGEEMDVTAFIDVELMKGVHSAVLMRDTLSLGSASDGVEDVGGDGGGGDDVIEDSDDDLLIQLLKAVTSDESVDLLTRLLPQAKPIINTALLEGRNALMLAALRGDCEALSLLLEHGANVNCSLSYPLAITQGLGGTLEKKINIKSDQFHCFYAQHIVEESRQDNSLTTPLHLAALVGAVECVEALIARGHTVDCRDAKGWSPLLYAHFEDHQDSVLALMRARPQQLTVLSDLLRRAPEEGTEARRRTVKVVRSLLVSLAHHEIYYSLFNSFISDNLSVLDEDGFGFMSHCMALLSFENKQAWLKGKLARLKDYAATDQTHCSWHTKVCLTDVPRDKVLEAVRERLSDLVTSPQRCWAQSLFVTFKGEAGICTGPRKEFWSCLCQAVTKKEKMFKLTDGGHLSLQPCSLFTDYPSARLSPPLAQRHTHLLHLLGMMLAFAVFHGDTLDLSLAKPVLKRLVDHPLTHPQDLEDIDQTLYHTLTTLQDEIIDDMELSFTTTLQCPWTNQTVDVPLREGGQNIAVTKGNIDDYIRDLSQFKLDTCVAKEMSSFLSGFWKVIPRRCLQVFKPNELALLISGVPTISVDDWYKHTQYYGVTASDDIIVWFWTLVASLKQEEKALLLKFSTGSPNVPAGGFSQLHGLSGPTLFNITLISGKDKIPQASTCFNQLKLSKYSCEQELRNKVLIALRYGCEGFAFS